MNSYIEEDIFTTLHQTHSLFNIGKTRFMIIN